MTGWRGTFPALVLLAACTAVQAPSVPAGARVDSISFEIRSWGYVMEGFRIASDGSGEFRKAPEFRAEPRVTRFNAGPAGFAQIRTALEGARRHTSSPPACGERITDLPYGDIVWQTGDRRATVSFNVGCRGAEMQQVVEQASRATRLAEGFARTNPSR